MRRVYIASPEPLLFVTAMIFNDVSKTPGRPSQPSRGKQCKDDSRHQQELDSDVEPYRRLFERKLNLTDTIRSWLPTRSHSEAPMSTAPDASPRVQRRTKYRRNCKSRQRKWFERYEPMKGKKVPDNCTPMEMLFFEEATDIQQCQSREGSRDAV